MNELMLMNPRHGGRHRYTYIDMPRKVKHLRVNPEHGNVPFTGMKSDELVKDGIGAGIGLLAPMYVPTMLGLKGWTDVAASGVTTIAGSMIATKVVGKTAGNVALATGAIVTLLKAVRVLKGGKKKTAAKKGLKGLEELSNDELLGANDELLGAGDEDLFGFEGLEAYPDEYGLADASTIRSY